MSEKTRSHVLLIEDNPADVRLAREVLLGGNSPIDLHVVGDGDQALAFLRGEPPFEHRSRPDLVLLDLNLPKRDGYQVLRDINGDERLRVLPVIVLTTSQADADVRRSYELGANAYVIKPVDLDAFIAAVRAIDAFWLRTAALPR